MTTPRTYLAPAAGMAYCAWLHLMTEKIPDLKRAVRAQAVELIETAGEDLPGLLPGDVPLDGPLLYAAVHLALDEHFGHNEDLFGVAPVMAVVPDECSVLVPNYDTTTKTSATDPDESLQVVGVVDVPEFKFRHFVVTGPSDEVTQLVLAKRVAADFFPEGLYLDPNMEPTTIDRLRR